MLASAVVLIRQISSTTFVVRAERGIIMSSGRRVGGDAIRKLQDRLDIEAEQDSLTELDN